MSTKDSDNVFHKFATRVFTGYGAFTSRHPMFVVGVGMIAFIVVAFGIFQGEINSDIDDLWVEKGTRLRDEREYWNKYWGGLIRKTQIAITPQDGVLTANDLAAMKATLTPLLVQSDERSPDLTNPKEIKLETFIGLPTGATAASTYRVSEMCESPPVPEVMKPYPLTGAPSPASRGAWSRVYSSFVSCLNSRVSPAFTVLPNTTLTYWGVQRFGCTRSSTLDCFREGNFDYPFELRQLDAVSRTVLVAVRGLAPFNSPTVAGNVTACAVSVTNGNPQVSATLLLTRIVPLFAGWGYTYRKSYVGMNATEINNHLQTAFENGQNPNITVSQCLSGIPCCLNFAGRKVPEQTLAGQIKYRTSTSEGSVGAIRTVANFWNENNPFWYVDIVQGRKGIEISSSSARLELVKAYEQKQIDFYLPYFEAEASTGFESGANFSTSKFHFITWRSTDDVVEDGSDVEGELIVIGYILLIIYSAGSFAKWGAPCTGGHVVYSRVFLGLYGVFCVAMAVVTGFGFTALIGIKFSPISLNLVPFLGLAVGVIDMYVVGSAVIANPNPDITARMKQVMGNTGPSIFLTSITNSCAFFISAITPIPAVQTFVIQLGITTLLNLLALLVLFLPGVYLDLERTSRKRLECCIPSTLCIKTPIQDEDHLSIKHTSDFVTRFTEKYFAPALQNSLVKVVVLLSFWAWFVGLAYNGFVNTETGLRLSDIALRGTYVRDYVDLAETSFGGFDNFLITKEVAYSSEQNQQDIINTGNALQESTWLTTSFNIRDTSWLTSASSGVLAISAQTASELNPYFSSLNFVLSPTNPPPAPNTSSPIPYVNVNISAPAVGGIQRPSFDLYFQVFIRGLGALSADSVVCLNRADNSRVSCSDFDVRSHKVGPSRQLFFAQNLIDHDNYVDMIKDTREKVDDNSGGNSFVYGYVYQFWEQYLRIERNLYEIVGWSLLGVFVITFLFQFSLISALVVCMVVLKSAIELYGFMFLIGVKVNAFSVVNICISVGVAVEFSAYYARTFMVHTGDRNERMAKALTDMMKPMIDGVLANLLSVVVLAFARFPFFRQYYFGMFYAMVLISFMNGMVFMPVVLSLVGAKSFHENDSGVNKNKNTSAGAAVPLPEIGMQRLHTEAAIPKDSV